jgi:hypothetical protein
MTDRVSVLDPSKRGYAGVLRRRLGECGIARVAVIGNRDHLDGRLLGFFCSARCPGNLILDTYDLARELRDSNYMKIVSLASEVV